MGFNYRLSEHFYNFLRTRGSDNQGSTVAQFYTTTANLPAGYGFVCGYVCVCVCVSVCVCVFVHLLVYVPILCHIV